MISFFRMIFVLWPTLPALSLLLFPNISLKISKGETKFSWKSCSQCDLNECDIQSYSYADAAEKRRAFKIFIIDGAMKTGTPKKLPKEQLAEAQKRWKSCRHWPLFWDPQEGSIISRSHTVEGKKSESYNQNHMIDL